jgi:hypothetical protein
MGIWIPILAAAAAFFGGMWLGEAATPDTMNIYSAEEGSTQNVTDNSTDDGSGDSGWGDAIGDILEMLPLIVIATIIGGIM